MGKEIPYAPIKGWIDLSKYNLSPRKLKAYGELQRLGNDYQETYGYQKQFNRTQLEKIKELCAEMQMDVVLGERGSDK